MSRWRHESVTAIASSALPVPSAPTCDAAVDVVIGRILREVAEFSLKARSVPALRGCVTTTVSNPACYQLLARGITTLPSLAMPSATTPGGRNDADEDEQAERLHRPSIAAQLDPSFSEPSKAPEREQPQDTGKRERIGFNLLAASSARRLRPCRLPACRCRLSSAAAPAASRS